MVYSSDFYTSRRPAYYKPSTSYSVTPLFSSDGYDLPPSYYKAHQVYQTCTTPSPIILTPPLSTGKPSPNVLPYNSYPYTHHQYVPLHRRSAATIHGVLDKIEHRPRSHPSYDPTDEYLNSRNATNFDDVTREIRAQTAGLLKQVYTPSIRPKISSVSNGYSEVPIAQRIESDAYIEKILADSESYRRDNNIGKGHLACVSYAGGKAYPRRRPHLSKEVDDNITMLSYYNKTREAVAASSTHPTVKVNNREKYTINQKEPLQSNKNTTKSAEKVFETYKEEKSEENASQLEAKKVDKKNTTEKELSNYNKTTEAVAPSSTLPTEKINNEEKHTVNQKELVQSNPNTVTFAEKEFEADKEELDEKNTSENELKTENKDEKFEESEQELEFAEKNSKDTDSEIQETKAEAEEKTSSFVAEELDEKITAEKKIEVENKEEEFEKTEQVTDEIKTEEEIEESEQQQQLPEKTSKDIDSEIQETNTEVEENASSFVAEELNEKNTVEKELEVENNNEEFEKIEQVTNEIKTEKEIEETEQELQLVEKTSKDTDSEIQGTNATATVESSATTTSTEIINEDDGEVKTTAIFQRTVTKTTTVTSTSVFNNDDDDVKSTIEINEVIEENGDSGAEDELDTEHQDVAQAEGQGSSEEENVSDCEESEEE